MTNQKPKDPKWVKVGKKSRRKGRRYEQEISKVYRAAHYGARRGSQARDGKDCADVIISEAPCWPIWIECGDYASGSWILNKLLQAERDCKYMMTDGVRIDKPIPTAHVHVKGRDCVMMFLDDFIDLASFRWPGEEVAMEDE